MHQQRSLGMIPVTLGSERACGGAAQTSTLVRSEGQLPLFLDDGIVAAAKVRNPPFVSAPGVKLRLAGMPLGLSPASCGHEPKRLLWSWPT